MTLPTFELHVVIPEELGELVTSFIYDAGATGLEEREADEGVELVVYSESREQLEAMERHIRHQADRSREDLPLLAELATTITETAVDWRTEWLRYLEPVIVGSGFVVVPRGDESELPPNRQRITLEPRQAFGVGSHPTSQMAAESVERFCRSHAGARVLDVGTGSGILGFVALGCGASRVRMIDIDPVAVDAARANARLNGMERQCEIDDAPLAAIQEQFDLVVANIREEPLLLMSEDLARVTGPEGMLSVTGLLEDQTEPIESRLVALGFDRTELDESKDWVLLEFRRLRR